MNESSNMRIAFFIESLALGGIGRLTLLLAEHFAGKGYHVDLVVAKRQGNYLAQIPPDLELVDLKASKLIFSTHLVGAYLKAANPDVLISANERVNIIALLAKKLYKSKIKVIISIHVNNSEQVRHEKFLPSLYRRAVLVIARLVYKWADQVVAVSKGVAMDACRLFKLSADRVTVIYNPLVTPEIKVKMKTAVEHPWLKQSQFPVILGIGRLTAQKDFMTLLEAFSAVRKDEPEARLIILGEGEKRDELEKKTALLGLNDYVSMPGFVDNPYSYLYHSSVFVLSSAWEGFGNVLVEAMATGTPVVATNCPSGPAEILEDGKYGPLVPVGDVNSLAQAVVAVLKDPPNPITLQSRAESFSVEKAVDKYLKLINS